MAPSPPAAAIGAWGQPAYFGRCFGFLHRADGATARGRGVVLCSPIGYEELCVHRAWGQFAGALAAAGLPTLRFDYPGCGDAPEADEDPERVRAWLDGIHDAAAFLRAETGVTEVTLVGLRFGATLAAAAAQEMTESGEPIAALALLAPTVSGEAFYKELRVLAMMARAKPAPGSPGIEAAGFHFSACTLAAMKALAPAKVPTPPAPTILVMDREDGGAAALCEAFRSKGCKVETQAFPGYTAAMREANDAEYPKQDFARVVAWLRKDAPAAAVLLPAVPCRSELPIPGGHEELVYIGAAGMIGVLSVPDAPQSGRPALLILNTAANHRIGHNRLSVMIARRLMQAGVTVLRFDVRGIGDSPSATDRKDRTIFDTALVADVRQAVDFLAALGHREIVVNGLSAGAWLCYQVAVAEPRVTGQILLNVQYLWVKQGTARDGAANREYLRRIRQKETWIRLMQGRLQLGLIVRMIASRLLEAVAIRIGRNVGRLRGTETLVEKTRRELGAAAARGVRSAFVYVREDPGLDEMEVVFGHLGRDLVAIPCVSVMLIEQGDHIFSVKASRDHLIELMAAQFSQGRFVPTTAGSLDASPRSAAALQSQTA